MRASSRLLPLALALALALGAALALALAPPARVALAEPRSGAGPILAFGGDVLPDGTVKTRVESRVAEGPAEAQVWREVFAEVAPTLRSATLAVVNLETPVSARHLDDSEPGRPVFNGPPELLDALVDAGVDVVTVANNHAYDQGFDGLRETLENARRRGVAAVGAGPDGPSACGPVYRAVSGQTIGFCSWTEGSNRQMPPETEPLSPRVAFVRHGTIERCLGEARRRASFVVAAFHWSHGDEPWRGPARFHREVARRAAEAGADLVVAHGPHEPGPAERLLTADGRSVPVLYSLGNLLGAMGEEDRALRSSRPSVRDAPVALVHTRRGGSGRLEVAEVAVTPFWIADPMPWAGWWPRGGQTLVRPLSLRRELERLSRARCGPPCEERARRYRARAAIARAAFAFGDEPAAIGPPPPGGPASEVAVATPPAAQAAPQPGAEEPEPARAEPEPASPAPGPRQAGGAGSLAERLGRGAVLPVTFRPNAMLVAEVDEAEVRRIVELLLEDHGLRVELTGFAARGETALPAEQLGRRRAAAAMHLIAGQGPSRSRFTLAAGEAGGGLRPGQGHVVIRTLPR